VVGVASDTTERKKAKEELANQRTLLRTVIDTIPMLMWMKDREGRFVVVNLSFLDEDVVHIRKCRKEIGSKSTR
jgi:PAS domain-containing protein